MLYISEYHFVTGSVYFSKKLEDTNKLAYLNTFPVQFADDDDYKQCLLDFLNIIATEVANLFYKSQINPVGSINLSNSDLIPELENIVNALNTETPAPIIINTEHDEPWSHV